MSALDKLRNSTVIFPHMGCVPCFHCSSCRISPDELADEIESEMRGTTRRIIKGDDDEGTHYAWCEAGDHTMNPSGEYCIHCGAKVVDDA